MFENLKSLHLLRVQTGLPQKAFAKMMGVPLRTYENLESGRTPTREVHLQAARMALVQMYAVFPSKCSVHVPLETLIEQTLVASAGAPEEHED